MRRDAGFMRRLGLYTAVMWLTWAFLPYAICGNPTLADRLHKLEQATVYALLFYGGALLFRYWPLLQVMTRRRVRQLLRWRIQHKAPMPKARSI